MQRIDEEPEFIFNIFSDKATFEVNRSDDLMKILTGHYRHIHRKIEVWASVLNNILIRPYFIEDNLISKYKDMLRNQILRAI